MLTFVVSDTMHFIIFFLNGRWGKPDFWIFSDRTQEMGATFKEGIRSQLRKKLWYRSPNKQS